jgi:hypothetical protein
MDMGNTGVSAPPPLKGGDTGKGAGGLMKHRKANRDFAIASARAFGTAYSSPATPRRMACG